MIKKKTKRASKRNKTVKLSFVQPLFQSRNRYPTNVNVPKSISDKAAWIAKQGVKSLHGWRNMGEIDIIFCKGETMPYKGAVLGCVYFENPHTMYINDKFIKQSWLIAKGVLHELYHIYQINTTGQTNDTDETVNEWSDDVLDKILYANCQACALSQASVDDLLLKIDNNELTGGILDLSGGTNSSPTNGALNTNYLSLVSKGWTVSIN